MGKDAAARSALEDALGASKKGAIQVDSPPPFMTRPVGGKPGHAALMYLVQHGFQKKVAGAVEIIGGRRSLF
jgi:hypothetical protein